MNPKKGIHVQIFDGSTVEINFSKSTALSLIGDTLQRACSVCRKIKPAEPPFFPRCKNERVKVGSTCGVCALARTRSYKAAKPVEYLQTITRCMKAWVKNNPDRVQEYGAARLQREKAAGSDLTAFDKEILTLLADGRCQCCGKIPAQIEFDHIRPLYLGGGNGAANRQLLCRHCNATKSTKCTDYRNIGIYDMDLAVAA